MADPSNPTELVETLRLLTITKSIDLAAGVIFLWDYILTVGMEVEFIWPERWTVVKIVFLIQRYVPFLDILWFGNHVSFGRNLSPEFCTYANYVGRMLTLVGLITSEIILVFRIWATWNCHKVMTFLLPVLFAACWIPTAVFLIKFIPVVKFVAVAPPFLGCVVVSTDNVITLSWIFILLWDTLSLFFMIIPAAKAYYFESKSALFRTVYGEGIVYYFYMFVLSTLNLFLSWNTSIPAPYQFLAVAMSRSLHAVFTSRVLLHIRAQDNRTEIHGPDSFQRLDDVEPRLKPLRVQRVAGLLSMTV